MHEGKREVPVVPAYYLVNCESVTQATVHIYWVRVKGPTIKIVKMSTPRRTLKERLGYRLRRSLLSLSAVLENRPEGVFCCGERKKWMCRRGKPLDDRHREVRPGEPSSQNHVGRPEC